jgi:hypothetical protein
MTTPIILLSGQAGSGKDTVAGYLVKNHAAAALAMADPMKRLGLVFNFTEDQLWGPSESRNAEDERFRDPYFNDRILTDLYSGIGYGWVRDVMPGLSEAQLKENHSVLVGWATRLLNVAVEAKSLTPRKMLQTLGTEWGRAMSKDMWINYAKTAALKLLSGGYRYDRRHGLIADENEVGPAFAIITDGRFRNELVSVLTLGGQTWKIASPQADGKAAEAAGVVGHKSETEQRQIPDHFYSAILHNDKSLGLKALEARVRAMVASRFPANASAY